MEGVVKAYKDGRMTAEEISEKSSEKDYSDTPLLAGCQLVSNDEKRSSDSEPVWKYRARVWRSIAEGQNRNVLNVMDMLAQENERVEKLTQEVGFLRQQIEKYQKVNDSVKEILGRALGYPEGEYGVSTGDHVPEALAEEAANRISVLQSERSARSCCCEGGCGE